MPYRLLSLTRIGEQLEPRAVAPGASAYQCPRPQDWHLAGGALPGLMFSPWSRRLAGA
ncbi:hypothetical protein CHLRE_16g670756v5 [Chlamydomonas reinhardtii]|uniref:Uncharacterized protein n=1 Tax=Chlamydomonas reinhardtii TaxID=3055 RepID=A0A2K3CUJ0_CHLRE|nr:uncharacterized protein CHLRE_16g670756v5 [Chlamydomonas reinhardtii]PNW71944.1 hypothetical protein CHLRE_16g670756v5 [Chlamydomonas reinhardtii]